MYKMPESTTNKKMTPNNQVLVDVCSLLTSTLGLNPGAIVPCADTPLLGVIPELDSMSVVTFLITVEEQYEIVIHDDEVDAGIFQTIGSLAEFLQSKLG